MTDRKQPMPAGLPGDPTVFKVMTEISIISTLGEGAFERAMSGKLTVAQFGVLNRLMWRGALETITELASVFQVSQPTMSSTVKRLIDKGCVEFVPDTDDRRIKRVAITAKGKVMREEAVRAIAPGIAAIEAALPDADWKALLAALSKLRAVLDEAR